MKEKKPKKRAKETTLNELGAMMSFVVEHMATKEDIADVRRDMATKDDIADVRRDMAASFADVRRDIANIKMNIAGIHEELRDIKARLRNLEVAVKDHAGHTKEIDHAFERIAVIERHLGINPGKQKNASR